MIGVASWDEYHRASVKDKVIPATRTLLSALHYVGHDLIGITSRPGKWRIPTTRWMVDHSIHLEEILMRDDDDFRQAPEIKLELARRRFGDPIADKVGLLIEDRDDVVSAFIREGVTCLHVRNGVKR